LGSKLIYNKKNVITFCLIRKVFRPVAVKLGLRTDAHCFGVMRVSQCKSCRQDSADWEFAR